MARVVRTRMSFTPITVYALVAPDGERFFIGRTRRPDSLAYNLAHGRHDARAWAAAVRARIDAIRSQGHAVAFEVLDVAPTHELADRRQRFWVSRTATALNVNPPGRYPVDDMRGAPGKRQARMRWQPTEHQKRCRDAYHRERTAARTQAFDDAFGPIGPIKPSK